jgi:hypothetical protein
MGFSIIVTGESLKSSRYALCAEPRRQIHGFSLPDQAAVAKRRWIRTLNPDFRHFQFVNFQGRFPIEPTEERWACTIRALNGDKVFDRDGTCHEVISKESLYEFLGFLSARDFREGSGSKDILHITSSWDAMGEQHRPDGVYSRYSERRDEFCAKCPVKDLRWGDCQPGFMTAGEVPPFLSGLQQVVSEAELSREYRETLDHLGRFLELERPTLDDLFYRVTGFYRSSESWLLKEGLKLIAGGGASRKVKVDKTARRLFAALFLCGDDNPFSQPALGLIIKPLAQLREISWLLIGKKDGRRKRDLMVFHQYMDTFLRALMMAKLHQLDIFISY